MKAGLPLSTSMDETYIALAFGLTAQAARR